MTDQQQAELSKVQTRPRSKWFTFFRWPALITTLATELKAEREDLQRCREAYQQERNRSALLETMHQDARKDTREALLKLRTEQQEFAEARASLLAARTELGRHMETIRELETLLKSAQLDAELAKAESTRTKAQIELACAERDRLTQQISDVQRKNVLASRFVHASFRLNAPPTKGIAALLTKPRVPLSMLLALAVLLPSLAMAQFPPPFWRNAWTTNVPPNAVRGQDNLSVTNLGSGTNWQFFNVGPFTIARLIDITNVASGLPFGSNYVFNPNQFVVLAGGTNVSFKAGAFQTNFNGWLTGTNHGNFRVEGDLTVTAGDTFTENIFPSTDDNSVIGGLAVAYHDIRLKSGGVKLVETGPGTEFVELLGPSSITASYIVRFPDVQGANMTVLTNDGSGNLGWWIPVAGDAGGTNARQFGTLVLTNLSGNPTPYTNILAAETGIQLGTNSGITYITNISAAFFTNWVNAISNLANTKQHGTASLTNLAGNPNVATNILGAGTVTVTSNNLGTWTITGAAGSSGSVFTQGVSVATSATNINFVNGSNVAITAINSAGNVSVTVNSPTDFTNIYYVNKDSNLSDILTNAPNNSTIWIGTGDWTNAVTYFASNSALGMFHLRNKTNIAIKAIGRARFKTTNEGDFLVLTNCSTISLSGVLFEGVKVTNISGVIPWASVWISACKDVDISNNEFRHIGNHAISEDLSGIGFYQSTNVYIHDNLFFWVGSWINNSLGWDGSCANIGSFWRLYRNRLYENATCFEFYGLQNTPYVVQSSIEDNYFENPIKWAIADATSTNSYNALITRNQIVFNNATRTISSNALSSASGMVFYHPKSYRIDDNTIVGAPSVGIFLPSQIGYPAINTSIERNYISNSQDGIIIGERATDTGKHRGNKVAGNKISTMSNSGITVSGSDTWVTDNDIENCALSFQAGIYLGTAGSYVGTNVIVLNNRIRTSPGITPAGPAIQIDAGMVNCRQFNNDITGSHPLRIVDNGDMPQPSLYVEMVTGIKTNPFVIYNTNRAPVMFVDTRGFIVITNGLTNRVATPTNTIAIGANNLGGFNLPNWTDHNGLEATLQPFIGHEQIYWLSTFTGAILGSEGIAPVTNGGTTITHVTPIETQPHMVNLATPATSNGTASAWSSADLANAGAHNGSSRIGGYFYAATWCSTNFIHGIVGGGAPRTFVGLTARATEDYTNMVVTTNATGQYVGLYADPKQSLNMYISARDASGEFRTNTGINFVSTNIYKFYLFNAPTSRFVGWRLDDAYAGLSAAGWFSNNVPTNFMKFGIATKNGTNRAHGVRFSRLYLQAPLSPPR